jgi:ligand-binding SRPBCC domain-containing protein
MLQLGKNSQNFTLDATQLLATPLEQLFTFFADAKNLEQLTPSFLSFQILTPPPIEMKLGALIDYRIKLRIIPMTWRTLISAWEPPLRFVDEQLKGPYTLWRHEHRFEAMGARTLVTDHVDYKVFGGSVVNALFVRPDLERIFRFRQEEMAKRFGS